jgi:hypothetical protein
VLYIHTVIDYLLHALLNDFMVDLAMVFSKHSKHEVLPLGVFLHPSPHILQGLGGLDLFILPKQKKGVCRFKNNSLGVQEEAVMTPWVYLQND